MKKIFHFLLSAAAASVTAILCCAVAFAACDAHQMDGGVITEEPTCERIGIVTYTCQNEGCDYSYVEKMGNLGHCYETGICVTCGEADELYVPEETVEETPVAQEAAELAEPVEPQASANASASSGTQSDWEPPFINPTVAAPESVTLAAPTAALTITASNPASDGSNWFLAGGMILILTAAAAVFTLIRKPELLRETR